MDNYFYLGSFTSERGPEIININHKQIHQEWKLYKKNELIQILQQKLHSIDTIYFGNKNSYIYEYSDGIKCYINNEIILILNLVPELLYDIIYVINYAKLNKIIFYDDPYITSIDNIYRLLLKNEHLNIDLYSGFLFRCKKSSMKYMQKKENKKFITAINVFQNTFLIPSELIKCIHEYFNNSLVCRLFIY